MKDDDLNQFRAGMADQLRREFAELAEPDFMERVNRACTRGDLDGQMATDDAGYLAHRGGAW